MKKNVYAVSGMKCVHCKVNVENALKALNGVVSAEAKDNSGRYELSL